MAIKRCHLILVLATALLAVGCVRQLFMLPYYMFAPEPRIPAEMHKLADPEKKKDVKVVLLTYLPPDGREEFSQADRQINQLFAMQLVRLTQLNKEKLTIVNPLKVEEYKNANPDWNSNHLDLEEVGKHFKADYVVYVEIRALSMYMPNTVGNGFYKGHADLTVTLVNVKNPDDLSNGQRHEVFNYPPESQGEMLAVDSDMPPHIFRAKFLTELTQRLAGFFADRPTKGSYLSEK